MTRYIKWGIWAYFLLLIFEGALRKWVLPGMSDILLIIRDPVVAGIYMLAIMDGRFPRNGFIGFTVALMAASAVFAFLGGHASPWVTVYGIRTNYLHVPLIWVMAETLDRRDVRHLGYALLAIAIPMTILMIMQTRSGPSAWVNRGVGGDEGGQIHGAMGRIRPPGFFSFITGPMVFFPLATAFCLSFVIEKKKALTTWFVITAGVFIALALPISISRGVMIISGCVIAVFLACIMIKGAFTAAFLRTIVAAVLILITLRFLPVTREAWIVFMDRWDTAAAEVDGDAWGSLTTRVGTGFTAPFHLLLDEPLFGRGIGLGSNVAAKLLSGRVGFLLSENEWERAIQELGPLVGLGFIGLRVGIWLMLFVRSWRALRQHGDFLPMLVTSATFAPLAMLQWAQATQLGFGVFGGGLALALLNNPQVRDDEYDDLEDEDEEDEDSDDTDDDDTDADGENDDDSAGSDDADELLTEHEKRQRRLRGLS